MDVIFSASIIAAFVAGMVALFAPCCITVLLPAYLASAFRERRNILKMTFIFFAGIAVIIVPIGLGAAGLAQLFRTFHRELYLAGGALMILFAVFAVRGKGLAIIPMPKRMATAGGAVSAKSVFTLGIFSGAATSCCAPVLAGAVTLAVLSGVFWKALVVTLAYVFGMTFPLFLAAYFYERFQLEHSRIIRGKMLSVRVASMRTTVHSTNLLAGAVFLVMGLILLAVALSGNAFWAPSPQGALGEQLNAWTNEALVLLMKVPDIIWGIIIISLFSAFLYRAIRKNSNTPS